MIRAGGQALLLPGRRDQGTPESAAFGSGRRRAVVSPGAIHQIHTCISRKKHPLPEGEAGEDDVLDEDVLEECGQRRMTCHHTWIRGPT